MRKAFLIAIVVIGIVAIAMFGRTRLLGHRMELKAYFQNAQGLRAGAPVRLAGVEVGSVTSVRARPEMQGSPAEVVMLLNTPYELKIPNDSTVSLATAGVLGETFAEIEAQGASGPPAKTGDVLKAKPTKVLSTEELIERLGDIIQRTPCPPPQGKDVAATTTLDRHGEERRMKTPTR
jgi:phospholipid/cholesterol/gamma-HCH transport system substrate-binding protein